MNHQLSRYFHLAGQTFAVVGLALPVSALSATELPLANSSTGFGWWDGPRGADMSQSVGPVTTPIVSVLNKGGATYDQKFGTSTWQISGSAQTMLGIQGVVGPNVAVSTAGVGYNVWGWAKVDGGASSSMYVRFVEDKPLPMTLDLIPVLFSASGVGTFSGSGLLPYNELKMQALFSVDSDDGMSDTFPQDRFKVTNQGTNGSAAFNDVVSLGVHQGYYNPWFQIVLSGNCSSLAFGNNNIDGTAPTSGDASCSLAIKSNLTLDQAGFDANPTHYGAATSFKLADYYHVEYSANVPAVPEPDSWAMLLAGLGLVATLARRGGKRA